MQAWIKIEGEMPVLTLHIGEASLFFSEADARKEIRAAQNAYSNFTWKIALHQRANRYILQGTEKSN